MCTTSTITACCLTACEQVVRALQQDQAREEPPSWGRHRRIHLCLRVRNILTPSQLERISPKANANVVEEVPAHCRRTYTVPIDSYGKARRSAVQPRPRRRRDTVVSIQHQCGRGCSRECRGPSAVGLMGWSQQHRRRGLACCQISVVLRRRTLYILSTLDSAWLGVARCSPVAA